MGLAEQAQVLQRRKPPSHFKVEFRSINPIGRRMVLISVLALWLPCSVLSLQATCSAVLAGLDPDVLEYIVSIVVEDDHILDKEDLVEAVCQCSF